MKRPLVWYAFVFSLGIITLEFIRIPAWPMYFLALAFLASSFLLIKKEAGFDICSLAAVFSLAMALSGRAVHPAACDITRLISSKDNPVYIIKGLIINDPFVDKNKTAFMLKSQELQVNDKRYGCCGKIFVHLKGKRDLAYGQELVLQGKFVLEKLIFRVKSNADLIILDKNRGFLLKRIALTWKRKIQRVFSKYTENLAVAILEAMVLGEKRNIPPAVNNSMMKTGTVHILVVSGFNVGIVASFILMFLKLIRIPRSGRYCLTVIFLVIYCLMTGASTPVVRATIMAAVFILAYLFKRETDIYNSLSIAALFILGLNPRQLFDIGFQLSFISVISIVYLFPKINSLLGITQLKSRSIRYLASAAGVSFSAWLGTTIPVIYYFRIFSPIAVLANIFILPLASLVTLCGFSLALADMVLPGVSVFFALSAELIIAVLLKINAFLIKIPGAYFYL